MASNRILLDGKYTRGFYAGRGVISYPFAQNGDYASTVIAREWRQSSAFFVPGKRGVDRDSVFHDAFLLSETEPRPSGMGDALSTQRTFARVPAQQTTYSTLTLTKPSPASLGTVVNFQEVIGAGVSTNLGANYIYLNHAWDLQNNRVYGPEVAVSGVNSGSDERVTWTAHGLAGTERIAINSNTTRYLFSAGEYSIIDPDTIDLLGWSSLIAITTAGKYLRDYVPGTDRLGCKIVSNFYLPGVTTGISTPADIPIPAPLLNDAEFLAEVVATLSGYVDYDSKELVQWMGSPIYQLDKIQINMADV